MAAENDLKRIFEMTYGKTKPKRYIESKTITANDAEISEENAARNEEIKALKSQPFRPVLIQRIRIELFDDTEK